MALFSHLSEKSPILICCHYWMELLIAGGRGRKNASAQRHVHRPLVLGTLFMNL